MSPRVTQRVRWGIEDKGLIFRTRLVDSSSCGEDEEAERKAPAAQMLIGSSQASRMANGIHHTVALIHADVQRICSGPKGPI